MYFGIMTTIIWALVGGGDVPTFKGEAGHYDQATAFHTFITQNEGRVVAVDALLVDFDGEALASSWFVLWDECEGLDVGEKPNNLKCTGTSYTLNGPADHDSGIVIKRGKARLQGRFKVGSCGGPYQGLMDCTLTRENIPKHR